MEDGTVIDTGNETGSGTGLDAQASKNDLALRSLKPGYIEAAVKGWRDRPDFLLSCILMGLNAPQISELSLSTPQPITTPQQVYDMIESHGHVKLFKSKKIENRRLGTHNKFIVSVFAKLYGQALELNHEVTDVFRDISPYPELVRFRPDIGIRISPRQFYVEVQVSKLELTRWTPKLANYLKLYEKIKKPFRVIVLYDRPDSLERLREYARWVLRNHEDLNLFYFLSLHEFGTAHNVMHEQIFYGAWHPNEKYSLMM